MANKKKLADRLAEEEMKKKAIKSQEDKGAYLQAELDFLQMAADEQDEPAPLSEKQIRSIGPEGLKGKKFRGTAEKIVKGGKLKKALAPFKEDFESMLKKAK